jgi:outer membrane biosynthesis protein TonB
MPKVPMIATRDFTYNTRRLKANDDFMARNRDDAMILVEVLGKARYGRPKADVPPPPQAVAEKMQAVPTVKEVLTAEVVEEPTPKAKAAPKPKARRTTKRKAKTKK